MTQVSPVGSIRDPPFATYDLASTFTWGHWVHRYSQMFQPIATRLITRAVTDNQSGDSALNVSRSVVRPPRSQASSSRYSRMLTPRRQATCPIDQPARRRSSSSILRDIAATGGRLGHRGDDGALGGRE